MYIVLSQAVSPAQKEMIEPSAQVIASDNIELALAFIQKTAVEKAIPEMDKRLATVGICLISAKAISVYTLSGHSFLRCLVKHCQDNIYTWYVDSI